MPDIEPLTDLPILLLAGPTASGKSARALEWAEATGGLILNADSMQLYADVPTLTARPSPADMKRVGHVMYGMLGPQVLWSAGEWLRAAKPYLTAALNGGRPVCVVGGTGLYFNSLVFGLADIPEIGADARATARATYDELGEALFRDLLKQHDPEAAARISPNDRQRLTRAYEVVLHTGKPLSAWQGNTRPALPEGSYKLEILAPERDELYARCDARLAAMVEHGALDEVRTLLIQGLGEHWPIMRVLGLREFAAHLRGDTTLDAALAQAQQATRNYAKRQSTWFRNQFPES